MYATYTYKAGSTTANILNDVVLMLTGTTDKTALSGDCVQGSTEILTTYDPAGWTVHDAATGTTGLTILSSPQADIGTKYVGISVQTAGYIFMTIYENWNAATNAATNAKTQGTTYSQQLNTTLGGILYISASNRRIVLLSQQTGTIGSSGSGYWSMVGERVRDQNLVPYDTLTNNLPLTFFCSPFNGFVGPNSNETATALTRALDIQTGASSTSVAPTLDVAFKGPNAVIQNTQVTGKLLNPTGGFIVPIHPIYIGNLYRGFFKISPTTDIYLLNRGIGITFDEITFNGKLRVVWMNAASSNDWASILIPKG